MHDRPSLHQDCDVALALADSSDDSMTMQQGVHVVHGNESMTHSIQGTVQSTVRSACVHNGQ